MMSISAPLRAATKSRRFATRCISKRRSAFARWAAKSSASSSQSSSSRMRMSRAGLSISWTSSRMRAPSRRRLVEDGPEHAEVLDGFEERVEVDRLHDKSVDAEFVASQQVAFLTRRGEHDDGNLPLLAVGLDLFENLQAVDLRQLQVEKHHGRIAGRALRMVAAAVEEIQRLRAVARN